MKGIQEYKTEILPQKIGESVLVINIGLVSLNEKDYDVEYNGQYYKITKK